MAQTFQLDDHRGHHHTEGAEGPQGIVEQGLKNLVVVQRGFIPGDSDVVKPHVAVAQELAIQVLQPRVCTGIDEDEPASCIHAFQVGSAEVLIAPPIDTSSDETSQGFLDFLGVHDGSETVIGHLNAPISDGHGRRVEDVHSGVRCVTRLCERISVTLAVVTREGSDLVFKSTNLVESVLREDSSLRILRLVKNFERPSDLLHPSGRRQCLN
mmetsp:Transcript_25072/g.65739  ORF Transcript_25072/g.65739 Transcript_25072/m.65739 type:complete len:212 (+) Transcript_25072:49-684(+)